MGHDVKVCTQCRGLGEDVADLKFELRVKGSAAEAELVLVVLDMLTLPLPFKKAVSLRKNNAHKVIVKAASRARNWQA